MFKINYTKESLSHQLNVYYNNVASPDPTKFYVILCNLYSGIVTDVNTTTGSVNLTGHTLTVGDTVRLSPESEGVLPTPFITNRIYYVIESNLDNIKLSSTINGTAIIPSNSGVGLIRVTEIGTPLTSINKWTSKELSSSVANYTRINYNAINAIETETGSKLPEVVLNYTPTQDITFNYIVLLRDADSTVRSNVGGVVWYIYVGNKDIEAYGTITVPLNIYLKSEE